MLLNVPQFVFHTAMCERASFQYNKSIRQHIFTHCFSGWGVATGGGGDLFVSLFSSHTQLVLLKVCWGKMGSLFNMKEREKKDMQGAKEGRKE